MDIQGKKKTVMNVQKCITLSTRCLTDM